MDKTIRIWDTENGSIVKTLTGHSIFVQALTVLADGNLASGDGDGQIRIWNINTGVTIKTIKGHYRYIQSNFIVI